MQTPCYQFFPNSSLANNQDVGIRTGEVEHRSAYVFDGRRMSKDDRFDCQLVFQLFLQHADFEREAPLLGGALDRRNQSLGGKRLFDEVVRPLPQCPVIRMTGISRSTLNRRGWSSSPSMPRSFTSDTTTAALPAVIPGNASDADGCDSILNPARSSACSMLRRVLLSSSMRMTLISVMRGSGRALQGQNKLGTSLRPIVTLQITAELACDTHGNDEPKAEPMARFFGRKERLKKPRQIAFGNSVPIVLHPDLDTVSCFANDDRNARSRLAVHGVHRVGDEIDENLLQTGSVCEHPNLVIRQLLCNM